MLPVPLGSNNHVNANPNCHILLKSLKSLQLGRYKNPAHSEDPCIKDPKFTSQKPHWVIVTKVEMHVFRTIKCPMGPVSGWMQQAWPASSAPPWGTQEDGWSGRSLSDSPLSWEVAYRSFAGEEGENGTDWMLDISPRTDNPDLKHGSLGYTTRSIEEAWDSLPCADSSRST